MFSYFPQAKTQQITPIKDDDTVQEIKSDDIAQEVKESEVKQAENTPSKSQTRKLLFSYSSATSKIEQFRLNNLEINCQVPDYEGIGELHHPNEGMKDRQFIFRDKSGMFYSVPAFQMYVKDSPAQPVPVEELDLLFVILKQKTGKHCIRFKLWEVSGHPYLAGNDKAVAGGEVFISGKKMLVNNKSNNFRIEPNGMIPLLNEVFSLRECDHFFGFSTQLDATENLNGWDITLKQFKSSQERQPEQKMYRK